MAEAATRFLGSLNPIQRKEATFPFAGDERYTWNYRPTQGGDSRVLDRNGLRIINMTSEQQQLALALIDAGMSKRSAEQARWIMELEDILREHERADGRIFPGVRDSELYWFSVFGEPGGAAPWAWRAGGHHIAFHFTVVDREMVSATPCFLGANPAQVALRASTPASAPSPRRRICRERWSRASRARTATKAIFSDDAPQDIMTDAYRSLDRFILPRGVAYSALSGEQRDKLVGIVKHYIGRVSDEIAAQEWDKVERAGLDGITFAWGGPVEKGAGHYYAIQGPTFIVEYDNTQNNSNHIHSVWRTFDGDWGEDILAAALRRQPQLTCVELAS